MNNKEFRKPRLLERAGWVSPNFTKDSLLTDFGKATLDRSYLMPGESYQDCFARVATYFADDQEHANRLYTYISNHHFMPATPVLSNGGTTRGLPISCFLNDVGDSIEDIVDVWNENVWLARHGGGIGCYWGDVRSMGEKVGANGKTTGIMPFIKVQDSLTLAISQGSLRRGSAAVYIPVWHPEIEEFIELRRPTGGDPNRRALNLHHGVVIDDKFMMAVEMDLDYDLLSPKDGSVIRTVKARDIWIRLLIARVETGEPYLLFVDNVNASIPDYHKKDGLYVKQSNLCIEITLFTGIDYAGKDRTAVCCLSSINLERWDEIKVNYDVNLFVSDILRFLDNVLSDFIEYAPKGFEKAVYSATMERSVGLGVMGFHAYLQSKNVAIESNEAISINKAIFSEIHAAAKKANVELAKEKGSCPDAARHQVDARFSNMIAIAPTASISIIAGTTSPSTEPFSTNAFTQKTLSGVFTVKNKYLTDLLESRGVNTKTTWDSILANKGSVQHLPFLTEQEKAVFKTAFEIDQTWLIKHAADRQPFICQSQSLNLFIHSNIHKSDLHKLHYTAWKSGVKSLYYCRSMAIKRAEVISEKVAQFSEREEAPKYEECLACQ